MKGTGNEDRTKIYICLFNRIQQRKKIYNIYNKKKKRCKNGEVRKSLGNIKGDLSLSSRSHQLKPLQFVHLFPTLHKPEA